MRHSLKAAVVLAAVLSPSLGLADPLQIWVHGHGNGSDGVACDETSFAQPLKTLHKAIGCTFVPGLLDREIEIILRCAPGTTCGAAGRSISRRSPVATCGFGSKWTAPWSR